MIPRRFVKLATWTTLILFSADVAGAGIFWRRCCRPRRCVYRVCCVPACPTAAPACAAAAVLAPTADCGCAALQWSPVEAGPLVETPATERVPAPAAVDPPQPDLADPADAAAPPELHDDISEDNAALPPAMESPTLARPVVDSPASEPAVDSGRYALPVEDEPPTVELTGGEADDRYDAGSPLPPAEDAAAELPAWSPDRPATPTTPSPEEPLEATPDLPSTPPGANPFDAPAGGNEIDPFEMLPADATPPNPDGPSAPAPASDRVAPPADATPEAPAPATDESAPADNGEPAAAPGADELFGPFGHLEVESLLRTAGGLQSNATRAWNTTHGGRRWAGRLTQVTPRDAVFTQPNGLTTRCELRQLSTDDLQFVRSQIAAQRWQIAHGASSDQQLAVDATTAR